MPLSSTEMSERAQDRVSSSILELCDRWSTHHPTQTAATTASQSKSRMVKRKRMGFCVQKKVRNCDFVKLASLRDFWRFSVKVLFQDRKPFF
jgi:hypothetical protein